MAQIYTVLSGKGGVGKSTFCANEDKVMAHKNIRVKIFFISVIAF